MKRFKAVVLSMTLLTGVITTQAQQQTTTTTTTKTTTKTPRKRAAAKTGPTVSEQLNELKQAIEAQQQQIRQLSDQVQTRDQKIQQLEQKVDQTQSAAVQAQTKADTAVAQSTEQQQTVVAMKSDVTDLKTTATNNAMNLMDAQKTVKESLESPLAIHYKGITITPGGFLAAESVYRNRALAADINTPLNSVSMPGSGANKISEFYGSGRQSRIALLAEGKLHDVKLSGYYEADFLSAGVTSNNNQSNSYTLRQRQVWGQAAFTSGLSVTGGQMWSLVTETKKGVDNRSEALPMTIDPQYTVGFSWARQFGFRVAQNFGNHVWLAASLENPQTTFAASGNAANFAFGSPGNGGGLYNGGGSPTGTALANYSFNAMPDVIVKAAFEPGFGHYEVFGILSRFRDRVYPCVEPLSNPSLCGTGPSILGAYNSSKFAGGVGGNARVTLGKKLDLGVHAVYGNGVGRYGTGSLPDATVNPNGTLAPLRSYQGLATVEWHSKKLDVYLNGGEEYVGKHFRTDFANTKLPNVGYGAPTFSDSGCYIETLPSSGNGFSFGGLSSCSGQTQSLLEGTFGFWVKPYNGPKGRIQLGPQYSYLIRNAWPGTGSTAGTFVAPHGIDNMFFASFRYYLP
jgi:outer membrane murein-binding lipoprotein Lpp